MDNARKHLEDKLYNSPRIVDANIKGDTPRTEARQVECGKGFGFLGKKSQDAGAPTPPPIEEMGPPPYSDLGKKAKDVFNKGYHFGLIKLDVKTKSASGVEFSTSGSSNQESGKVAGSLETKYKVKDYGLTFTEKWTTDNTLSTEFAVQDQFVPGLKLSSVLNFAPQTGGQYSIQRSDVNVGYNSKEEWGNVETKILWRPLQKTGNVKSSFTNSQVALNADAEFTADGPQTTASAVVGYQGWLAGYQAGFDVNNKKLTKSNFALGFTSGDFTLHSNVDMISDDGLALGGSIYNVITPKLEVGIMIDWASGNGGGGGEKPAEDGKSKEGGDKPKGDNKQKEGGNKSEEGDKSEGGESSTKFAIGAQYQLDADASIRCFVNNQMEIGLGYQQRLRPDDGQEFGGSIYQKINPKLETGVSLNWSSGSSNTKFGISAKYDLDQEASLRFKVNNQSQIGLGYQQRLRDGVTLTLSTLIDGKNFNQGGHKVGLALELEA